MEEKNEELTRRIKRSNKEINERKERK